MSDTALSPAEFARLLGCRPSYVAALRAAGRLVMHEDGKRVLAEASRRRIEETRDPAKRAVAERHAEARGAALDLAAELDAEETPADAPPAADAAVEADAGSSYQEARTLREQYLARAAKRDYEISIGKLLDAEEVASAVASAVTEFRARLEGRATILASQLATAADEAAAAEIIAESDEYLLGELARRFAQLAKGTP